MKKEKPHKEQPPVSGQPEKEEVYPLAGLLSASCMEREPGPDVQRQLAAHYASEHNGE